jgi:hypothetical protein
VVGCLRRGFNGDCSDLEIVRAVCLCIRVHSSGAGF